MVELKSNINGKMEMKKKSEIVKENADLLEQVNSLTEQLHSLEEQFEADLLNAKNESALYQKWWNGEKNKNQEFKQAIKAIMELVEIISKRK